MQNIRIRGARTHNLKNIDLDLPRDRLIVLTGLSGSGKSSLAFDTIYAEGQRRYVESLSTYARQFLSMMEKRKLGRSGHPTNRCENIAEASRCNISPSLRSTIPSRRRVLPIGEQLQPPTPRRFAPLGTTNEMVREASVGMTNENA